MNITIFGTGYVGLVTGTCFAEKGHIVTCVDIDAQKISQLNHNIVPIYEPKLEDLIKNNRKNKRLFFTVDYKKALEKSDVIFIAVGTPSNPDGSANCQYVFDVAKMIGENLLHDAIIIIKSTIPIGTSEKVHDIITNHLLAREITINCTTAFNPEFLKQGHAVDDCLNPDRIVIGCNDHHAKEKIRALYQNFPCTKENYLEMDTRSAEMTKYVANAMLATKISFMNEMSQIADRLGADIHAIKSGIGKDSRIGPHFIEPGCGYGGSCFPKDVKALQNIAKDHGYTPRILEAIDAVNHDQKLVLFNKLMQHYNGNIAGKSFAIWGLSFKPNTDDLREASSIVLINSLLRSGAIVKLYDPKAMSNFKKTFPDQSGYVLCDTKEAALENTDALCIVTEWDTFKSPNYNELHIKLNDKIIFDGRNVLNKATCDQHKLQYVGL